VSTASRPTNRLVGSPVARIEDLRFLRGRGQYVDDLAPDGLLHAAILRSAVAHGRIRAIDAAAARARSGVTVITAADIGTVPMIPMRLEPLAAFRRYEQPVLAHAKVRYVGEPLAVVVAQSAALAEDALEAIAVDIESLPAVADRDSARADAVLLFEEAGTNVAGTLTAVLGDADAAFETAPYRRREHFKVQRHTAVAMEPRGLVAQWDAGRATLTVFGAAKIAFPNRRMLAKMMDLPETSIRMWRTTSAAASGCAANSIRRIF
jgi:carbon-monoxide dehydrogenase large subunit